MAASEDDMYEAVSQTTMLLMISFMHSFGKTVPDLVALNTHTQMHTHTHFLLYKHWLILYMHTHTHTSTGRFEVKDKSHFHVTPALHMNDNWKSLLKWLGWKQRGGI